MGSADGHCRPFDANAQGTVFGSGAGVVLLKRLEDALADGDPIYAVIKGFAVNNDGSEKVGYTAPSLEGQANVIAHGPRHCRRRSRIDHLSGSARHGDAAGRSHRIRGLDAGFPGTHRAKGFCALGTVKANVGHLEAAAGVTGLINAVQALVHEQLPPAVGFEIAQPATSISPTARSTSIPGSLLEERRGPPPAGVSSFGVGGTNAHVVLEDAPLPAARGRLAPSAFARLVRLDRPRPSTRPPPIWPGI